MPSAMIRQRIIPSAKRIVVKVGTNTVCHASGGVNHEAVEALAVQIAALIHKGIGMTLVASGAIGTGLAELGLTGRPKAMPMLQGVAAIGQGQLMRTFHDAFARLGVRVGQVLLTREDFEYRRRYLNIRNTLAALRQMGALAIVNENDTVAVEEIRFGENDILAALVANMLGAELLVFLTSVDGVLDGGKVLDVIEQVDEKVLALVTRERSSLGSGGMATKLAAAGMVSRAGAVVVVAPARMPDVLARLLAGEQIGTVFLPARRRMSSRRRWIGQASRVAGRILVDAGAAKALLSSGKSLLPSGITAVAGKFAKGTIVAVLDPTGREIARGQTNYSADQIDKIKGLKTGQIAKVLGEKPCDEVIHRNNMTLG